MKPVVYDYALAFVEYVEASALWLSQILEQGERELLHLVAEMARLGHDIPPDVETLRRRDAALGGALARVEQAIADVYRTLGVDAPDDQVWACLGKLQKRFRRLADAFPCPHCGAATLMTGLTAPGVRTCLTCDKTSDMPVDDEEEPW